MCVCVWVHVHEPYRPKSRLHCLFFNHWATFYYLKRLSSNFSPTDCNCQWLVVCERFHAVKTSTECWPASATISPNHRSHHSPDDSVLSDTMFKQRFLNNFEEETFERKRKLYFTEIGGFRTLGEREMWKDEPRLLNRIMFQCTLDSYLLGVT